MQTPVAAIVLTFLSAAPANFEKERPALYEQCVEQNEGKACATLAQQIDNKQLKPRFAEEGWLFWKQGCRFDYNPACDRAEELSKKYPDPETYELDSTCMFYDGAAACEDVAGALEEQSDHYLPSVARAKSRIKRAFELYKKGCDENNNAEMCRGASRVMASTLFGKKDPKEAKALLIRSCDLHDWYGCEQVGDMSPAKEAVTYYQRACAEAATLSQACLKLAQANEKAKAPMPELIELYSRACGAYAYPACEWLIKNSPSLEGQSPEVITVFKQWCSDGSEPACERLKGAPEQK